MIMVKEILEIPRCTEIGLLESLHNNTFNEISVVDEKKMEAEVSMYKFTTKPMPNNKKVKQDVFCLDKRDIGLASNLKHGIDLIDKEPT
jgi:hypothetical protein